MSQRDKNRVNFPEAAIVLDGFKSVFGEGVKLMYASENGSEIGRLGVAKFDLDGEDFLRLGRLCRENKAIVNKPKAAKK